MPAWSESIGQRIGFSVKFLAGLRQQVKTIFTADGADDADSKKEIRAIRVIRGLNRCRITRAP
jgi:hypothetical protein